MDNPPSNDFVKRYVLRVGHGDDAGLGGEGWIVRMSDHFSSCEPAQKWVKAEDYDALRNAGSSVETQPLHPSLCGLSREQQATLIEHLWEALDGCERCAVRFRNLRVSRPVEPSPTQHAAEYFGKKLLETNEQRFQVTPENKP